MKEWFIKHKNEIFVGIICSVAVTLIIKASEILTFFIQRNGQSLWTAFVDYIFRKAAIQNSVLISLKLYSIVDIIVLSSFITLVIVILRIFSLIKTIKMNQEIIKQKKSDEIKSDEILKAEKTLDKLDKKYGFEPAMKRLKILALIFLLLCLYMLIKEFSCTIFPAMLYHDYKIDIIQITPYISEHEVKIFESRWVSMKGKADYDAIYEEINDIKQKNNLTRYQKYKN